ncbi:unnamed protein product [Thelazia callipaeda]|uniref:Ras family protein n=1 Tax=Thelazia callipaeda TaxID=103827 RepID=A0A0N5D3G6_THECL|nr:unnamed protein product [Thelazia callipaeda]
MTVFRQERSKLAKSVRYYGCTIGKSLPFLCFVRGSRIPEHTSDYRVAVFGAGGVGKSSIVLRFIKGTFNENYVPTIEDTYRQICYTLRSRFVLVESMSTIKGDAFERLLENYRLNICFDGVRYTNLLRIEFVEVVAISSQVTTYGIILVLHFISDLSLLASSAALSAYTSILLADFAEFTSSATTSRNLSTSSAINFTISSTNSSGERLSPWRIPRSIYFSIAFQCNRPPGGDASHKPVDPRRHVKLFNALNQAFVIN